MKRRVFLFFCLFEKVHFSVRIEEKKDRFTECFAFVEKRGLVKKCSKFKKNL